MAFGILGKGFNIVFGVKDNTQKPLAGVGRNLDRAREKTKDFTQELASISRESYRTTNALNRISQALDFSGIAGTKTMQMEKQFEGLTIQAGLGAKATEQMSDAALGLANRTGLSSDETAKLVTALAATGQQVTDLDPKLAGMKDRFGAISDGAGKNTEALTEMVGRFGISASAAVQFATDAKNLGMSIGGLTDQTTKWQEQYRMPGMIAQLPQVVGFAQKSLLQFGRSVAGDSKTIIASTMKMSASYARAFGVDMVAAIGKLEQHQQHMMSQIRQDQDVFLGLSDNFSALTNSLFEAGMGFEEIQKLEKQGQDDPIKYAESLKQIEDQMKATYGPDSDYVKRFHRQMMQNSSEVVQGYLEIPGALDKAKKSQIDAAAYQKSAAGQAETTFGTMTSALKDVGSTAIEAFYGLIQLGKQIIGMTFAKDLGDTFKGLAESVRGFNKKIKEMANEFHKSETYKKIKPILQGVGKVLIIIGAAVGAAATAFATLYKPVHLVTGVLGKIPFIGKGISGFLGGLGGLAKKLLLPIAAVMSLGTALNDIGEQLKDPTLTGGEKAMAVLRGAFVGVADFIDNLFLGLPGKILGLFIPRFKDGLAKGVKRFFNSWKKDLTKDGKNTFGAMWTAIIRWSTDKMVELEGYVQRNLSNWKVWAGQAGRNIGRALVFLFKTELSVIRAYFSPSFWKGMWHKVVDFFSGPGGEQLSLSFVGIMQDLMEVAHEFTDSLVDEFIESFGDIDEDIVEFFEDTKDLFSDAWENLGQGFDKLINYLVIKTMDLSTAWSRTTGWLTERFYEFAGVCAKGFLYLVDGVVELFIKGSKVIAKTLTAIIQPVAWIAKKLGLIQNDVWDTINNVADKASESLADATGKRLADVDDKISRALKRTQEATKKEVDEKEKASKYLNELYDDDAKKEEKRAQQERDWRTTHRYKEREARKKDADEKQKAKQKETDKFAAAKAAQESNKTAATEQVESIIAKLEEAKKKYAGKKNSKAVAVLEGRIDKEKALLDAIDDTDASNYKALQNTVGTARKIAGLKQDLGMKRPGAKTPEGLPPLRDFSEKAIPPAPAKAAEGAGKQPAGPPDKTYTEPSDPVKVSGTLAGTFRLVDSIGRIIATTVSEGSVQSVGWGSA